MRARPSTRCWVGARVPVINENDTVATNEIRYGDNDRLAARVATMVSADLLVLLVRRRRPLRCAARRDANGPPYRPGAAHHAADRGDGGRRRLRTFARRHADQDRGGADRHQCRHAHGHRVRRRRSSAAGDRRGRALHLVPHRRPIRSRRAKNGLPARSNRRARWQSTPVRQRRFAAARACCRLAWWASKALRARRCGDHPRSGRRRSRPRPVSPTISRMRRKSVAVRQPTFPAFWASAAAPR